MHDPLPPLGRLAERILGGSLTDYLRDLRAAGHSWDTCAKRLWADTSHEVDVSGPTVQAWAERLGLEPGPPPANDTEGAA